MFYRHIARLDLSSTGPVSSSCSRVLLMEHFDRCLSPSTDKGLPLSRDCEMRAVIFGMRYVH